jgi:hypothetical protein
VSTHGFSQYVLNNKVKPPITHVDGAAAIDVAQLISGSLVYRLYERLIPNDYDMDAVTEHLEMLHESEEHIALLYFIFILCDAADVALPERFESMTTNTRLAPYLSAAILEDWMDFHGDYGS